MIEQEVEVIAIEGGRLLVEAERQSSCQTCSVKSGCGTSVLAKWFDRKHLRFYVENTSNATVGDRITVGLQESALTQGALLVYLLPLLVMIAVALSADYFLSVSFYWRDLIIAGAALAGLVLSLVASRYYFQQSHQQQRFNPVVLSGSIETHREQNSS